MIIHIIGAFCIRDKRKKRVHDVLRMNYFEIRNEDSL